MAEFTAGHFTILGAGGVVGSRLVDTLRLRGTACRAITRHDWPEAGTHLGHAIYAIGITADFRTRPGEAVEAHAGLLARVLRDYRFDSFTYMSSARLYRTALGACDEEAVFGLSPADTDKLYDLSKLTGECLCHAAGPARTHIVRMSNAYAAGDASPNFLPSVLKQAVASGQVTIRQSAASCKDYVALDDAVAAIIAIAERGQDKVYTVASGHLTSHGEIAEGLRQRFGFAVDFQPGGVDDIQPHLSVSRLAGFMDWNPRRVMDDLPSLVQALRVA